MASRAEQNPLRQELGRMSMVDLLALEQKMGVKKYSQQILSNLVDHRGETSLSGRSSNNRNTATIRTLQNKPILASEQEDDAPLEVSSKRPPRICYKTQMGPKPQAESSQRRDPRFDERCGKFDQKIHARNFEFVEELRKKERTELVKLRRKEKDPEMIAKFDLLIQRIDNQTREAQKKEKDNRIKRELTRVETPSSNPKMLSRRSKEEPRDDKRPVTKKVFVSKSHCKRAELVSKFMELKKSGKLNKYLDKKRKMLSQEEKRQRPEKR